MPRRTPRFIPHSLTPDGNLNVSTLKDRLEVKRRESGACTQAGIITWHLQDILAALEQGMTYQAIHDVMKEEGVVLSVSQFRDAVNRARRKLNQHAGPSGIPKNTEVVPSVTRFRNETSVDTSRAASTLTDKSSPTPTPISQSTPMLMVKPASGWELELQDDKLPPDLLKKAFVQIAGIKVDLRQPCPAEFGENHEEIKHQANPSSPNWSEFRARAQARTTYAQDQSYWNREFKKWLISQGYTGTQY